MDYKLTATLENKVATRGIMAVDDADATFAAINYIMDAAYKNQTGPWALGKIALTNENGELIQEMEAK